jgi:hypothetical protein
MVDPAVQQFSCPQAKCQRNVTSLSFVCSQAAQAAGKLRN